MLHAFCKMAAGLWLLASGLLAQTPATIMTKPRVITTPVISDADDVAIWAHPTDPSKSLVIGTDKGTYPDGGLFTWDLNGTQKQRINISHPNSVDVRHGLKLGGETVDIAAVSMRDHRQVRIFKIDRDTRMLSDVTTLDSTNVLNKMFKSPYGLALYQRPTDGFIFAIVSSRNSESKAQLWQIRLEGDGAGRVKGTVVRTFGAFSGIIEGMVADDELGFIYAVEEKFGIHKYYADPQKGNSRLAFFGADDSLAGNYEGLALYKCSSGAGYLLVACPSIKSIRVYRREGENGDPHRHHVIAMIRDANSAAGDGLEVLSRPHAPIFPHGFLVWHDQPGRRFQLYAWEDVAQKILTICPEGGPTAIAMGEAETIDSSTPATLRQNSPNPFNPDTEIRFEMRKAGPVQLTVYNFLGAEVKQLLNASLAPGTYLAHWDATDNSGASVSSGIYFYQLRAGPFTATRGMVLMR